jgi:hypothetical protein
MAATDAPQAFRGAMHGTVFLDGLDHVLRAGGCEAALAPQEWADGSLVESNALDEAPGDERAHLKFSAIGQ